MNDIISTHNMSLAAARAFVNAYRNPDSSDEEIFARLEDYIRIRRMLPKGEKNRRYGSAEAYLATQK